MSTLIYIHGFLSSPKSTKAGQTRQWLQKHHADIHYECPFLPPYPRQARKILVQLVEEHLADQVYLIGSSLGGYWATWLAERYDLRAVVVNPLVDPHDFAQRYIGSQHLENYHTGDIYQLTREDMNDLVAVNTTQLNRPENFWLLAQTGDDTLDYRLAVEKYRDCQQLIEKGGSHAFENYEDRLPEILSFLKNS